MINQIARLPVIHIKNHINISDAREKNGIQNNRLYYSITHVGSYNKSKPSIYLAQQPIYTFTKQLW